MTTPEEHAARGVPPTPSAFSVASTGAAAFQSWLMEEEEEWRMGRLLEAKCPKEFICPISLDIMADPIILVETGMTYDRHNIRKWLLLGGSTCPLTGVKLITRKVVSHKHLRQRIEHWVATGGSLPAEASAILAEDSRVCASEASYQVLSQGPPRFDSGAMPDSPRADSVATSAGHASTVRRRAWLFERAPSEASSMGLPRQHSRRHGPPRRAVPAPARQPQPNVSSSSMLLCKFSSSALSKITAGSSRATSPMASPRSAGNEEEGGEQPEQVDAPASSIPMNTPASKAVSAPVKAQSSVSGKQSGAAAAASAASRGEAAAGAGLKHRDISAPPSTPKTPMAAEHHSPAEVSAQQAARQEEGSQAADWSVFSEHGLQVDQSLLAQAHAAMLTIESEGWVQESEIAGNSEVRACECPDPGEKEQEAAEAEQADEEPHDQSCTDIAAAAAPEQEGEDHAQDQSEVLAALEEALADDGPSKELIVAADPGATGSSTKSSSTGSANISVIATADMIVRRPRNRVSCLGVGVQPKRGAGTRRQVAPGALFPGSAPASNKQPSPHGRHRREGSISPLQKPQKGAVQREPIILPPRGQSRAAQQGSSWARCFGCNVPPSLRTRVDRSGATSRAASARVDQWVEGSDEEIVTMDNFARHVIAAAAEQDAAAAAESCAARMEAANA